MAIDLIHEHPLRPTQAARWVGRRLRRPVHVSTIYRWFGGLRGRRLEYVQCGGTRVTTVEALERFFAALAEEKAEVTTIVTVTAGQDQRRAKKVDAEPAARGL